MRNTWMGVLFFACVLPPGLEAQEEDIGPVRMHISFEYGGELPMLDMADRFGPNFKLGSQIELMETASLFSFGLSAYFLWGGEVREDVLTNLRGTDGIIIGNNRAPVDVALRERGIYAGAFAGKLFNINKKQPLSGIKLQLGAGFLQHKIRVQDNSRTLVQVSGDYIKGYDRLSNGVAFQGFLGYQQLDKNRLINFLVGFDVTYALTKNRRDFDFATLTNLEEDRRDSLIGFKIGWILPIISGGNPDTIYY